MKDKKMRKKLSAKQTLKQLIQTIEAGLTELRGENFKNEFIVGEWYAYVECIEIITRWNKAEENGLNYDPETKFNII